MMSRLGRPLRSLVVRLLVLLFLTVAAVLGVHAAFSYGATKQQLLQIVGSSTERCSGLIQRATHDGMLLNRLDEVQATIERLAEGPDVEAIRVLDKEGAVILSAAAAEIGHEIPLDAAPCQSCHLEGAELSAAPLQTSKLIRLDDGREVLRFASAIENELSCVAAECHPHPSESTVLGILEVEMSMAPLQATLDQARWQLVRTTLALFLVIGVVATVFIRRVVGKPLGQLYGATQRIAAGDLDTHVEVHGQHELARLAEAFNQMSEDLLAARSEITNWSQKLEDKVMEKTAALQRTQRQVIHMEKMASLGKLAATVAHELNNPLTGVLTYTRLVARELKDQPLEEEVQQELARYLHLMDKECHRCGDIVKNLLLFARRRGAELAPVDVNEEVERGLMLIHHHMEISNIELRHEPLVGDSQIVADPGQLQQALVALLVNAIEAMAGTGEGGGVLSVDMTGTADEISIDIGDTGQGIPPEVLPHIFEPFFSTKEEESRVGLGLAVVYGIVRRHGGTIEVESEPGRGTVFHLRLPRRPKAGGQSAGNADTTAGTERSP